MGIKVSVDSGNSFNNYVNNTSNKAGNNSGSTGATSAVKNSNDNNNPLTPEELNFNNNQSSSGVYSKIKTTVDVDTIDELAKALSQNMSGDNKESAKQIDSSIAIMKELKKETESSIKELEAKLKNTKDKKEKEELEAIITEKKATVLSIDNMIQEYQYAKMMLSDEYQNFIKNAYTEKEMTYGEYKKLLETQPDAYIYDPETEGLEIEILDCIYSKDDKIKCRIPKEVDINNIPSILNGDSSLYINPYINRSIDGFESVVNSENEKIKKVNKEYMSVDQRNMYLFILYYTGPDAAYKYYESIRNNLFSKQGKEMAEARIAKLDINDKDQIEASIKNFILVSGSGEIDGIQSFFEGINNIMFADGVISAEDYEKLYFLQYLEEHSKIYDEIYGVSNSIGNMVPSMTASAIISLIGGPELAAPVASALMGASAGGNAKELALQKGADQITAILYGAIIGVSEGYLGEKLGNIPGLSESAKLSIEGILKEGLEEYTQEYIEGFAQSLLLGEPIDLSNIKEDAQKAFILGCVTSGILNTGTSTIDIMFNGQKYNMNSLELLEYLHEHDVINMEELTVNNTIAKVVKLDSAMQTEINSIIKEAEASGRYSLFMNDGIMSKLYGPNRLKYFATIKNIDSKFNLPLEFGQILDEVSGNPDYVLGIHKDNFDYNGNTSDELMSVMSNGLINQGENDSRGELNKAFTTVDSNSISGLLALADDYQNNNTLLLVAFPSEYVDSELKFRNSNSKYGIYNMTRYDDVARIKPEYIVCAVKQESTGLDNVILRSEILPDILATKINDRVSKKRAEGKYSLFMFDSVLERLNTCSNPDLLYYMIEEYDNDSNIPIECGKIINDYLNNPDYTLGIHRTNIGNGEFDKLTSIMEQGVMNEGHNNAKLSAGHLDVVPEIYTTFRVVESTVTGLGNLFSKSSHTNVKIIAAFPSDAVAIGVDGSDKNLDFVDAQSADRIYYYPNGQTYSAGDTPYIKPEYIVGAILENADGTEIFITREDYLNGNY